MSRATGTVPERVQSRVHTTEPTGPVPEPFHCDHIARWSARSGTTGRSGTGVNTGARLRSGTVPVPNVWCEHGLTVKLNINKKENIIISSWYRKPGSSIDICIDTLECIFRNTKQNTKIFLCGDFNINLLNQDMHKGTNDFIEQLFSLGLYPLIDRPSRITTSSATLIDNIFTNQSNCDTCNGLLINDISDHLPVFSISKPKLERKCTNKLLNSRMTNQEISAHLNNSLLSKYGNTYIKQKMYMRHMICL